MENNNIEEIEDKTTDEEIELKEKPKKEKKPFVMTEKRLETFEKARKIRQANIDLRKLISRKTIK